VEVNGILEARILSAGCPQLIENASHVVGIAIERRMEVEERPQTRVALEEVLEEIKILQGPTLYE
jgi:hypothetical protein